MAVFTLTTGVIMVTIIALLDIFSIYCRREDGDISGYEVLRAVYLILGAVILVGYVLQSR